MNNIFKHVTFNAHTEDIRQISKALISIILARNAAGLGKEMNQVDAALLAGSVEEILAGLQKVCHHYRQVAAELETCIDLISLIPDTEVVEDLSNLKKDSGGVN